MTEKKCGNKVIKFLLKNSVTLTQLRHFET